MNARTVGDALEDRIAHNEVGPEVVEDGEPEQDLRPVTAKFVEGGLECAICVRHCVLAGDFGCSRTRWKRQRGRREYAKDRMSGGAKGAAHGRQWDAASSATLRLPSMALEVVGNCIM